jgi:multiple sugar transport system permease protein
MVKTKQVQPNIRVVRRQGCTRLREMAHAACFLGPSFLGVLLFFIVPFGVVVYYSTIHGPMNDSFVGLQHYKAVLQNGAFKLAVDAFN